MIGGIAFGLGGYIVLRNNGMLLDGVSPWVQLVGMYPFAVYGSKIIDNDHNPQSAPCKDIVGVGINRLLHLTTKTRQLTKKDLKPPMNWFDAKHRSWQTHSTALLYILLAVLWVLINSVVVVDVILLRLFLTGLVLGVLSHLVLDLLTPEGIWSLSGVLENAFGVKTGLPKKINLVPNSKFFSTGGTFESIVRLLLWVISWLLLMYVIYLELPYKLEINF